MKAYQTIIRQTITGNYAIIRGINPYSIIPITIYVVILDNIILCFTIKTNPCM